MKRTRDQVFIWPSWVSKLIAGESQCEWAIWFKAHYQFDKVSSDFNLARWTINHQKALQERRRELETRGYRVLVEDQNSFHWQFKPCITISGKADIVAFGETSLSGGDADNFALIEDIKTGRQKTSDFVQVVLYMMFLPKALPQYTETKFEGTIVYRDGANVTIPPDAVDDESLTDIIWETLIKVSGPEAGCRCVPSSKECSYCDITKSDCPPRIEK